MEASNLQPKVSVLIVTWRSRHLIDRCLAPLQNPPQWLEVVVVDNASPDGTADYIAETYPWVRLLRSNENLGFGRGNNLAYRHSLGEVLVLLNPDAFLSDLAQLERLVDQLQSSESIGALAPQLIHEDGRHQVGDAGWLTSPFAVLSHLLWIHRLVPAVKSIYLSNPSLLRREQVVVDWLCGACLLIRRDAFARVGGFSEKIFMYGEDVDLGERLNAAGYGTRYYPAEKVLHIQGATQRRSAGAHYSTRWVDARVEKFAAEQGRRSALALQACFFVGFTFRYLTLSALSLGKASARTSASQMKDYALHSMAGFRAALSAKRV